MRWMTLYRTEERRVILADIVMSRTVPEGSREPIVIRDRRLAEAPDLFDIIWFSGAAHRSSILQSLKGQAEVAVMSSRRRKRRQ